MGEGGGGEVNNRLGKEIRQKDIPDDKYKEQQLS